MEHVNAHHLAECASTQDEARQRLVGDDAPDLVVVTSDRQLAGRGRAGRRWVEPPGAAIFASIGSRGPLPVAVLQDLPHDVARLAIDAIWRHASIELAWKSPNDIVAPDTGAKVGGVLVDARTQGEQVGPLVVGIGVNVSGPAFATADGRQATTLEAIARTPIRLEPIRTAVVTAIADRISARR